MTERDDSRRFGTTLDRSLARTARGSADLRQRSAGSPQRRRDLPSDARCDPNGDSDGQRSCIASARLQSEGLESQSHRLLQPRNATAKSKVPEPRARSSRSSLLGKLTVGLSRSELAGRPPTTARYPHLPTDTPYAEDSGNARPILELRTWFSKAFCVFSLFIGWQLPVCDLSSCKRCRQERPTPRAQSRPGIELYIICIYIYIYTYIYIDIYIYIVYIYIYI